MVILAFVVIALVAGYVANYLVGKGKGFQQWEMFMAGIIGSFVGGTILATIANEGLNIGLSGLVGSTLGAIIVLVVWGWVRLRFLADRGR